MELFKIGFVSVRLVDIIDISIVTFLFFKLYELLRGSLALRILGAILVVFFVWKVVDMLDFLLLRSIIDLFLGAGAISLVVIFAPEIRRFLVVMGKNTFLDRVFQQGPVGSELQALVDEILDGVEQLCNGGIGALIVITDTDNLERIQETGDRLDAEVSGRLLHSIFITASPLHDGAVVIAGGKIAAARCVLPITQSADFPPELGMRHRAALGLSETSHALILIVSEERKEVSIAFEGKLERNIDLFNVERKVLSFYNREKNIDAEIKSGSELPIIEPPQD